MTASCGDVRELTHEDGRRLFASTIQRNPTIQLMRIFAETYTSRANVPGRKKKKMSVARNFAEHLQETQTGYLLWTRSRTDT